MTDRTSVAPWAPPVAGLRAARALGAAAVVTIAAAGAHLGSGGQADGAVVVALYAALVPLCWSLAGERLGTGRLLGLLVLAQAAVHLACSSADPSAGGTMLVGHAVGTAVSLAVLTWGERALLALADRVVSHWSVPRVGTPALWAVPATGRRLVEPSRIRVLVVGERAPPAAV
ncbi:hypothetical protein ASD11_06440 [Aeromicrobium sp. Root495]|uniref:hypothetical protein n=1 Tax=Aeromicrobium sp. Root495 TaxID=1736550 RepID=UPI0006FC8000|nr:hypothetical protein [Aeromicrobium sp. Root495]KQY59217.1 hypothetical protein ASD11_06440 [Aeromicrobium sp. Root495]